jgi:restriction system protein
MSIPDYQSIMLPLLEYASDGKEHLMRSAYDDLAIVFGLSEEERKQLLPSGRQPTFENRVGWASTYMKKAGLLSSPKRGYFQITQRGLDVLKEKPSTINRQFLQQFSEFDDFWKRSNKQFPRVVETLETQEQEISPEEAMEESYVKLRDELANELLETIKSCSPSFFEQLVVDLLVKMGYGGTRKDAGMAIGRSGDGGIDGIIKEDRLGLDEIYIQAKRWEGTVSRPEIQKFAGALLGQQARRGVFITTSDFSKAATDYASAIDSKIVLIDGETLSQFLIDFDLGVSPVATYSLKKIDLDYFTE